MACYTMRKWIVWMQQVFDTAGLSFSRVGFGIPYAFFEASIRGHVNYITTLIMVLYTGTLISSMSFVVLLMSYGVSSQLSNLMKNSHLSQKSDSIGHIT